MWFFRKQNPRRHRRNNNTAAQVVGLVLGLRNWISTPARAGSVLSAVTRFLGLSEDEQEKELPNIYLLLEQYLVEVDLLCDLTRDSLRGWVQSHYPNLLVLPNFGLLFKGIPQQELLLCRKLLLGVLRRANSYGNVQTENAQIASILYAATLEEVQANNTGKVFQTDHWLTQLRQLSQEFYRGLVQSVGEKTATRFYEESYRNLAENYRSLQSFSVVIDLLPDLLLDEEKISLLSRSQIQRVLLGKVAELQNINNQISLKNEALEDRNALLRIEIQERRQVEEALRQAEERYRLLFESNPQPMWVFDLETLRFLAVNEAAVFQYGYSRAEFAEMKITDIRPREDLQDFTQWCKQNAHLAKLINSGPWRHQKKDGTIIQVEIIANTIQFLERPAKVVLANDITERQRTESLRLAQERTQQLEIQMEELQRLSRLKDDFLSTVSHELRTPMSNMKLAIHMLRQSTEKPEQRHRYLNILQEECSRETDLINNLLDLQRLEAKATSAIVSTIDLHEWIPNQLLPFLERAEQRQQALTWNIEETLKPLATDRRSLERIVAELVNNACKYTNPEGCIHIQAARTEKDHLQLAFRNSGSQIPPEELPRIFEKFYRVPSTDPWQQGGTGLGLALVQKLVEQLHGHIAVRSIPEYTEFIVTLPSLVEPTTSEEN
jgi:PAS domain S-box-containing protein